MKLDLAVIQFPRKAGNMRENIKRMGIYLQSLELADGIVVLPEDWLGPVVIPWTDYLDLVTGLSLLLPPRCLLVSGAQYVQVDQKIYSRGLFVFPDQKAVIYDKHFPSRAVGEREFLTPGHNLPVIEFGGVTMGAVVCVDLFYPELVRSLAFKGATIIFNPANIPSTRMALWHALGLARAAENTAYVVMANNTATRYSDGRLVAGGSFLARPHGYNFTCAGSEEGIHYFTANTDEVDKVRARWPFISDIKERW